MWSPLSCIQAPMFSRLLVAALLGALLPAALSQGVPPHEVSALLDLYHATSGPTWRRYRWPATIGDAALEDLRPCSWPRVSCKGGHVHGLHLEDAFQPGGHLPATLATLSHLEVLDLGSNGLQGTLPSEWGAPGSLASAKVVEMDGNSFVGDIPSSWSSFLDRGRGGPPREGAPLGGTLVFIGFNVVLKDDAAPPPRRKGEEWPPSSAVKGYGFECPYPEWLTRSTTVQRAGRRVPDGESSVATAWGLPLRCGLTADDVTPDNEEPREGEEPRREL